MKKIIVLSVLGLMLCAPTVSLAKGSVGRSSSSFRSSSSIRSVYRPSTPTVRSSAPTTAGGFTKSTPKVSTPKPAKVTTPKVTTKPSAKTPKVTSPTAKKVAGKNYGTKGSVVGSGYQPKFRSGYTAPAGSVVYYERSSMLDWLPFYMIMSSQNAHRSAVVVEPAKDGQPAKETVVKEEGVDTMYVINWIITILLVGGIIGLIVYKVNKNSR